MNPNDFSIAKARQDAVETYTVNISCGWAPEVAADHLGISRATLDRWTKAYRAGGIEALIPRKPTGRPPLARLSDAEVASIQGFIANGMSEIMACREAAYRGLLSEAATEAIYAERKSKHCIPSVIRRQVHLAEAVKAYARGPKNYRLKHLCTPRKMTEEFDGQEIAITPGDWFVSDDMTANFAWWTPWPHRDCESSKRYGVKVSRGQCLATMDVGSYCFLGFDLLVRKGESYQANDIWASWGRLFRAVGMPRRRFVLEGSNWQSKQLHGEKVAPGSINEDARIGGLQSLGVGTVRSWTSKTKDIEHRFNFLQTVMDSQPGNLGRFRDGEREWNTYNRCIAGAIDPRKYLPSQDQLADAIAEAMRRCNYEPVDGRKVRGIPAILFDESVAAMPLAKPDPKMGWVFSRDVKTITAPSNGLIQTYFKHTGGRRYLHFSAPELLLLPLEHTKLQLCFDPLETGGNAVILSADARPFELNGHKISTGDFICVADYVAESPMLSNRADANIELTREKNNAVRAAYRTITGGKTQLQRMTEAYDGFGQAVRVTNGMAPADFVTPARKSSPTGRAGISAPAMPAPERGGGPAAIRPAAADADAAALFGSDRAARLAALDAAERAAAESF